MTRPFDVPPRTNHAGKLRGGDAVEVIWRQALQTRWVYVGGCILVRIRRARMFTGGIIAAGVQNGRLVGFEVEVVVRDGLRLGVG